MTGRTVPADGGRELLLDLPVSPEHVDALRRDLRDEIVSSLDDFDTGRRAQSDTMMSEALASAGHSLGLLRSLATPPDGQWTLSGPRVVVTAYVASLYESAPELLKHTQTEHADYGNAESRVAEDAALLAAAEALYAALPNEPAPQAA